MASLCTVTNCSQTTIAFHDGFFNSTNFIKLGPGQTATEVVLVDHVVRALFRNPKAAITVLGEAPEPVWTPPSLVRYPRGPQIPAALARILR
jgi:hypothetical protein